MSKTSHLTIEEFATQDAHILGHILLNNPKTLNSMSLEMAQAIYHQLEIWAEDTAVVAVVIEGHGDKAFCAGGDIQKLYHSAIATPGGPCEYGEAFFLHEYRLNYTMHQYTKPIICLGNGIVMGGGMGLLMGSSHRVVTEHSRLSMPEISIGLYPDVGGTWFLSKLRYNLGYFLALTGAPLRTNDALVSGLVNHTLQWSQKQSLIEALRQQSWNCSNEQRHALVSETLTGFALSAQQLAQLAPSQIQRHHARLEQICTQLSFCDMHKAILDISDDPIDGHEWMHSAREALLTGSPLSSVLIYEQLKRYRYADLRTIFLSEYILSTNILRYREFPEGIRALLIDKDKNPKWTFPSFDRVPASVMNQFFIAPWSENPLAALLA